MSLPLPSFDAKRRQNRHKVLNTTIPEFGWNDLSDKEVIGSGSFGSVITAKHKGNTVVIVHRDLKPANILVSNQMYCDSKDKEVIRDAWEKEPIICKLVDFGESRGDMNQTASICSTQTTNIDRGTPVYMAPELLSTAITSLSLAQLKACDVWSYGMVLFMLLNPDLQFPYQLEIDTLPNKTYEMSKREVVKRLTSKQLPTFSNKYSHFQATTWLTLEQVFENCTYFDSTKRINASCFVDMLNPSEGSVCRDIALAISQSSAVEQYDQLVAENALPVTSVIVGDATNSCSFLSVLVAERVLAERHDENLPSLSVALDEWQFFGENISDLLFTMPARFNRYRDIERMYDVHEAYSILRKANIVQGTYDLFEEIITSSPVFTKNGRELLCKAVGKLAESNTAKVAIYTCGMYIFVIGCRLGRLFIVDTHTIAPELGGNGAGLLKVFLDKDLSSQRNVCAWVWKRLALSGVKGNAMQSFVVLEEFIRYLFITILSSIIHLYNERA